MNNTKRKKLSGRVTFFLFTLIPVVLYTFFYVVSVINGIRYSFTDWDGMAQKMNFILGGRIIRYCSKIRTFGML